LGELGPESAGPASGLLVGEEMQGENPGIDSLIFGGRADYRHPFRLLFGIIATWPCCNMFVYRALLSHIDVVLNSRQTTDPPTPDVFEILEGIAQ
jgi:hypothetical protein